MPCTYYSAGELEEIRKQELDRVTRLLCKMVDHFGVIKGDKELAVWKAEHDEMDRKRIATEEADLAREEAELRRREVVAAAMTKLTAEEIEAIKRTT